MKYVSMPPKETVENLIKEAAENPDQFYYPRPITEESSKTPRSKGPSSFWAYKCWVNALECAEKGSGLEEFFRKQDLHFTAPEGFVPEKTISMSPASDIMPVDCITDEFTPHILDDIRDFWLTADLPTANLEITVLDSAPIGRNQPPTPPGSTKPAGFARMNTSTKMLDKFVNAGVRYFSLANNHTLDYLEEGRLSTIRELDKRGVYHSGTNLTEQEHDSAYMIEEQGIKIAMLNATCAINAFDPDEPWMVNLVRFNIKPVDLSLIEKWIADAKKKGADLIILHAHWDFEFEMYPHVHIEEVAHKLCEMGVDIIVGSHPHVSHPAERYVFTRDGEEHQALIFTSLGDFVSFHPATKNSHITYIPRFDLVKGTVNGKSRTIVQNLKLMPVYIMAACDENENYDFRLLRFSTILNDKPDADGNYKYKISEADRADLPRLKKLWEELLLPENAEGIAVE